MEVLSEKRWRKAQDVLSPSEELPMKIWLTCSHTRALSHFKSSCCLLRPRSASFTWKSCHLIFSLFAISSYIWQTLLNPFKLSVGSRSTQEKLWDCVKKKVIYFIPVQLNQCPRFMTDIFEWTEYAVEKDSVTQHRSHKQLQSLGLSAHLLPNYMCFIGKTYIDLLSICFQR